MLELVLLVIGLVVGSAVGIFVFSRNPRNIVNQIYAFMTVCILLFTLSNYLSLETMDDDDLLLYIRLVMLSVILMYSSLYYLVWFIGNPQAGMNRIQKFGLISTVLLACISVTDLLFKGVTDDANPTPIPNVGMAFYLPQLLTVLAASVAILIKRVRSETGIKKRQSKLMLIGIAPIAILSPITSLIMPSMLQNRSLVFLGPVYATFFVTMIGYAILRHKLFDIRPVIARTVGYLFSLVAIVIIFTVSASLLSTVVLGEQKLTVAQQALFVSLAILVALLFPTLKNYFDKLTNRLFYRDAYEPQVLIDELNQVLVSSTDMTVLLGRAADLITAHLKVSFCTFYIQPTNDSPARIIGKGPEEIHPDSIRIIDEYTPKLKQKVLSTEEYLSSKTEMSISKPLQENDIVVVAQLVNTAEHASAGVGYVFMGAKKSGSAYTRQDLKIIEIIANGLVVAIENILRYEEIDHFNITLQQKIEKATHKLKSANKHLKELDQQKDDFISMTSHQLKPQLTASRGFIEMLDAEVEGKLNKGQAELLTLATKGVERMTEIVRDLLDLSKMKSGTVQLTLESANLKQITGDEVERLRVQATDSGMALQFDAPKQFPDSKFDTLKIKEVITNLIHNAIQYSSEDAVIVIKATHTKNTVSVEVRDAGIGVPKSEQKQLFTKFYRAKNAIETRPNGSGIGLFLVKKMIEAHGGKMIFTSIEGKGSTFGFTLPLHPKEKTQIK